MASTVKNARVQTCLNLCLSPTVFPTDKSLMSAIYNAILTYLTDNLGTFTSTGFKHVCLSHAATTGCSVTVKCILTSKTIKTDFNLYCIIKQSFKGTSKYLDIDIDIYIDIIVTKRRSYAAVLSLKTVNGGCLTNKKHRNERCNLQSLFFHIILLINQLIVLI